MKRVCINRLRNEAQQLAATVSFLEQQEDVMQELFEVLFNLYQCEASAPPPADQNLTFPLNTNQMKSGIGGQSSGMQRSGVFCKFQSENRQPSDRGLATVKEFENGCEEQAQQKVIEIVSQQFLNNSSAPKFFNESTDSNKILKLDHQLKGSKNNTGNSDIAGQNRLQNDKKQKQITGRRNENCNCLNPNDSIECCNEAQNNFGELIQTESDLALKSLKKIQDAVSDGNDIGKLQNFKQISGNEILGSSESSIRNHFRRGNTNLTEQLPKKVDGRVLRDELANIQGCLNKSSKEALKIIVQLMIEDIWSNFENYSLQRKVVMHSQEFKQSRQNRQSQYSNQLNSQKSINRLKTQGDHQAEKAGLDSSYSQGLSNGQLKSAESKEERCQSKPRNCLSLETGKEEEESSSSNQPQACSPTFNDIKRISSSHAQQLIINSRNVGRENIADCERRNTIQQSQNVQLSKVNHGQSVLVLSKKSNCSFVSNASHVAKSNCSVCGNRNNFKMDFLQPSSVCQHQNFLQQDKIVDLPLSNTKSKNANQNNCCKCKSKTIFLQKQQANQSLVKDQNNCSILSQNLCNQKSVTSSQPGSIFGSQIENHRNPTRKATDVQNSIQTKERKNKKGVQEISLRAKTFSNAREEPISASHVSPADLGENDVDVAIFGSDVELKLNESLKGQNSNPKEKKNQLFLKKKIQNGRSYDTLEMSLETLQPEIQTGQLKTPDSKQNEIKNAIKEQITPKKIEEQKQNQKSEQEIIAENDFEFEIKRQIKKTIDEPVEHINMCDDDEEPQDEFQESSEESSLHISIQEDENEDMEGGSTRKNILTLPANSQIEEIVANECCITQSEHKVKMLSPRLERVLIENIQALEMNLGAKAGLQMNDFRENEHEGPKTVRMYKRDREFEEEANTVAKKFQKVTTNTIKEMSCESHSVEPSPKSQQSPGLGISPSDKTPTLSEETPGNRKPIQQTNNAPSREFSPVCVNEDSYRHVTLLSVSNQNQHITRQPHFNYYNQSQNEKGIRKCIDDFNTSSEDVLTDDDENMLPQIEPLILENEIRLDFNEITPAFGAATYDINPDFTGQVDRPKRMPQHSQSLDFEDISILDDHSNTLVTHEQVPPSGKNANNQHDGKKKSGTRKTQQSKKSVKGQKSQIKPIQALSITETPKQTQKPIHKKNVSTTTQGFATLRKSPVPTKKEIDTTVINISKFVKTSTQKAIKTPCQQKFQTPGASQTDRKLKNSPSKQVVKLDLDQPEELYLRGSQNPIHSREIKSQQIMIPQKKDDQNTDQNVFKKQKPRQSTQKNLLMKGSDSSGNGGDPQPFRIDSKEIDIDSQVFPVTDQQTQSWNLSSGEIDEINERNHKHQHFRMISKASVPDANKTQYETAEQVRDIYYNQNFMPAKNEGKDVPILMQMSREFNPIVCFDVQSMGDNSGSNVTSSYNEYSYHQKNPSTSTNGHFNQHYGFQGKGVPCQVDEQNEEHMLQFDEEEDKYYQKRRRNSLNENMQEGMSEGDFMKSEIQDENFDQTEYNNQILAEELNNSESCCDKQIHVSCRDPIESIISNQIANQSRNSLTSSMYLSHQIQNQNNNTASLDNTNETIKRDYRVGVCTSARDLKQRKNQASVLNHEDQSLKQNKQHSRYNPNLSYNTKTIKTYESSSSVNSSQQNKSNTSQLSQIQKVHQINQQMQVKYQQEKEVRSQSQRGQMNLTTTSKTSSNGK